MWGPSRSQMHVSQAYEIWDGEVEIFKVLVQVFKANVGRIQCLTPMITGLFKYCVRVQYAVQEMKRS